MKKRLLIIGYDQPLAQDLKRKWLSDGLYPYYVGNLREAVELDRSLHYSLVLILGKVNVMEVVRAVRQISKVPILVVRKRYDGAEKIAVLEAGADEYVQCPKKKEEGVASVRALIRRYTEWNPCYGYIGCEPSEEGLCIMPEHRRAVCTLVLTEFAASWRVCLIFQQKLKMFEVWATAIEKRMKWNLNE